MGVHLRRFPEYQLELPIFCNSVSAKEMLALADSLDKGAKWLAIFCEGVDLSGLDIANFPRLKRAITPGKSESYGGEPPATAFVNLAGGGELFASFWVHYVSVGVDRFRKHEMFPTIAAACQWLGLPPAAAETLASAAAEAAESEAATTSDQADDADSRGRIVRAASRLFRERGFDGATEVEIMEAAHLPPDRFNSYFTTKNDLIFYALVDAIAEFKPPEELREWARYYLSAAHKADLAGGCPVAALGQETAHQSPEARAAVTALGLIRRVERLSRSAPGHDASTRRRAAIRVFSAAVGALMLARLSDDPEVADEFLDETLAWITDDRALLGASAPSG